MTFDEILALVLATALALVALGGALAAWRVLGRAGRGMRELEKRLDARILTLPNVAATARDRLAEGQVKTETVLWTISNLDARIERVETALVERRAASDRLRASMARNRGALEQLRKGARTVLRAIQMRREFLG